MTTHVAPGILTERLSGLRTPGPVAKVLATGPGNGVFKAAICPVDGKFLGELETPGRARLWCKRCSQVREVTVK